MKSDNTPILCDKGKLSLGSAEFDPNVYARVAQKSRIVDLRALKSSFDVKEECVHLFMNSEFNAKKSYDCDIAIPQYFPDSGLLLGRLEWKAIVKDGNRHILKASSSYNVAYESVPDAPKEYLCLFFEKLARFSTYPYFRSYFSNSTSAAGIMLPPLPSLSERMD